MSPGHTRKRVRQGPRKSVRVRKLAVKTAYKMRQKKVTNVRRSDVSAAHVSKSNDDERAASIAAESNSACRLVGVEVLLGFGGRRSSHRSTTLRSVVNPRSR
jgi:hypothetical protein